MRQVPHAEIQVHWGRESAKRFLKPDPQPSRPLPQRPAPTDSTEARPPAQPLPQAPAPTDSTEAVPSPATPAPGARRHSHWSQTHFVYQTALLAQPSVAKDNGDCPRYSEHCYILSQ